MGTKSPGTSQRCRLILQHCLAIQLSKPGHTPEDFWMYDSGYMIFQNFLAANSQCWWNGPLTAATRALKYAGHVAPGMLLVTADPCALEVLRGAYARSVLKPPATYVISAVGDIDDCIVTPTVQGQFTPLPEALCDVIMDLTSQGQSATIENIRVKLSVRFPHMQQPSNEMIYDSLAQLMQEKKIYQTAKGYFIVTPERRRSRSRPRSQRGFPDNFEESMEPTDARTILMTNAEAVHNLYGEISTERDGDLTHQCIQTNLADVICGGNPNDKVIYARTSKRRSASFPTPRSLDRRHSLRLFGSSKRLQRCASTRSLSKNYAQTLANCGTDSSSSEYQSTDSSSPKKASLLSRLFRRSGRSKQRQIETYSAQFPPAEWFNSKAVHLHSVGTQTSDLDTPDVHTLSKSTFYDGTELRHRSSTLPRRHRRHMSSESTFVISSRDCSPIRRRSPVYCSGSLPRSTHSIPAASMQTKVQRTIPSKHLINEQNRITAKSGEIYRSPKKTSTLDNRLSNDRHYRSINSGPSSYESGKASILSGLSSIEDEKVSYSRTSGHYSLDSHPSISTIATNKNGSRLTYGNGNCSPKSSPKHQLGKSKLTMDSNSRMKSTATSTSNGPSSLNRSDDPSMPVLGKPPIGIPNSNSNSSITLQVTTSNESQIPNTKIFVQNSPVRSVITLENGKLLDNSNVYIINNETTTNGNGEIIKRSISKQSSPAKMRAASKRDKENELLLSENDMASETCDSLSFISETSPESSMSTMPTPTPEPFTSDSIENCKFTKNVNNDATMNNGRKFSLPISNTNNIVYKNVLKNVNDISPTSPLNNKNVFTLDEMVVEKIETINLERNTIAGSVGNLRFIEKKKIINSNCDLKMSPYEPVCGNITKLNSNPAINTDSIAQILSKNMISIGSEPNISNLAINSNGDGKQKINNGDKSVEKEPVDRRFSVSRENSINDRDELYNFPSLSDLSFNFTSLAAQKILKGVSINSIDTLVELNMAQEKQQNNVSATTTAQPQAICTDYGMV
ncbi:uncharacterized protein LOC129577874 isoform X2 [Sitodiplosis mosellana]|uniref:uncharacterized protein LOC129577874 isoform X2 n=1 Tax=Sitodiplosis mosellana TaxID=263140 RepID=UPI00244502B7|nr:uncharacterized protein LOC129577874 isoform X2 [Sitodiplosis mosellana]